MTLNRGCWKFTCLHENTVVVVVTVAAGGGVAPVLCLLGQLVVLLQQGRVLLAQPVKFFLLMNACLPEVTYFCHRLFFPLRLFCFQFSDTTLKILRTRGKLLESLVGLSVEGVLEFGYAAVTHLEEVGVFFEVMS